MSASLRCTRPGMVADQREGEKSGWRGSSPRNLITLPLSEKPLVSERGFRGSLHAARVLVDNVAGVGQAHVHGVEVRLLEIPELYIGEMRERDGEARGILERFDGGVGGAVSVGIEGGGGVRRVDWRGRALNSVRRFGDDLVPVTQLGFERDGARCGEIASEEAIDVQRGIAAEDIFGLGEDVVDVDLGNDAKGDFTINSAEGQVVDFVAEGRDVFPFGRVQLHR